jgi:hypothetical protein
MNGRVRTIERRRPRRPRPPVRTAPPRGRRPLRRGAVGPAPAPTLPDWLRAQSINVTRHAAALRPFRRGEFGTGGAAPTEGHLQAVNALIVQLRRELLRLAERVSTEGRAAAAQPTPARLQQVLRRKEHGHDWVRSIERVWDFYFELFGQRQSQYADWLLSCDRIALDCYAAAFRGVGIAKSIPAPPPFSYMRTGFSPATFRRGIPLQRLGRQLNPFPLIQLPYHRLVNPWTLGAVLHEVSHNLQNDLGLQRVIPETLNRELRGAGLGSFVASVWVRWHREAFADLSGLLLGGPCIVDSLMDVVGRGPRATVAYNPRGPHPTPYLRTFISTELLRRMGFPEQARAYEATWRRLYAAAGTGSIPRPILETFERARRLVVETVCFRPYATLGDRSMSQVLRFAPKDQQMIEEAAGRLAAGTDPGVVPARFLIGAARVALDRRLARPQAITDSFYRELARR